MIYDIVLYYNLIICKPNETDFRFGNEDQAAAGTQNVASQVSFGQGSSSHKFGAKPPRQAPAYSAQGMEIYKYISNILIFKFFL